MFSILLKRFALLASTGLFAAAMVAAPFQLSFDGGTLEKAVALAGEDGDQSGDADSDTDPGQPGGDQGDQG